MTPLDHLSALARPRFCVSVRLVLLDFLGDVASGLIWLRRWDSEDSSSLEIV